MTTYPNPGAIANVPPSPNKVESTWGNAIRDRVVNHFDNATDRDAAITSPVAGMTCYVDGVGLLVYAGSTDGWRPAWNMPWGYVASAATTTDQAGITAATDVTGATVTFTALTNRRYKVSYVLFVVHVTTDGLQEAGVYDGSNVLKGGDMLATCASNANIYGINSFYTETIASGSVTRKLKVANSGAGGTVYGSTHPGFILVEDIGPNGNPS